LSVAYKFVLFFVKMKKIKLLLLSLMFYFPLAGTAGTFLDVSIFSSYQINALNFTVVTGKYTLFDADKMITDIVRDETLTFKIKNDSILVSKGTKYLGAFTSLYISGTALLNNFKIKPLNKGISERCYDDDLRLTAADGFFLLTNHVELENYVAGVVQSEGGGSSKDHEFFQVQAITCRTYALNNIKKHAKEGFNLCDSIHCQLYNGRCKNNEILASVYKTAGEVIVDKGNNMISAAFHANSGGMTVNSEDIWKIPTSYLKAVADTFSIKMPGSTWEYQILQNNWLEYLSSRFNYPVNDPVKKEYALNFKQENRKVFFSDSILLSTIRFDLGLKSTWFSIEHQGAYLIFKGKGHGHGVGLSQQGAIRMAQLGYNFIDIIKFYYKDVEVVNYDELMIK